MTHWLSTPWFAVAFGLLLYGVTTVAVLRPDRLAAELQARTEADLVKPLHPLEPSWAFKNPEVDLLISELQREREAVKTQAQQLKELEARLAVERQELSVITQAVLHAQRQMEADFISIRQEETANLKRLAKVYASMAPEGAAKILLELDENGAAKLFSLMNESESAPILEAMGQESQSAARRVAQISDSLRRLRAQRGATPPARTP